jgi:hypothetical protein
MAEGGSSFSVPSLVARAVFALAPEVNNEIGL